MASDDWNPQYEEYEAEFNTLREEMDALGIGASFKPLIPYENWGWYRPSKRRNIVGNARRDNQLAIDRAKKAAAAAAAVFEAGNSQAGPSVRGRSNTRSPLAILTTRWIAQRAGSLAGIARWWGVARATASSLMAAVMQVLPSSSPAHILAKFGAPPDPTSSWSSAIPTTKSAAITIREPQANGTPPTSRSSPDGRGDIAMSLRRHGSPRRQPTGTLWCAQL